MSVLDLADKFGDHLVAVAPDAGDGLTFKQQSRVGEHGPGIALDRAGVAALRDALTNWLEESK